MKSKLIGKSVFLVVSMLLLVVCLFGAFGFDNKSGAAQVNAQAEQVYSLYEEDFDDITSRVNLAAGNNHFSSSAGGWIYSKKTDTGSAYVENGKMYFSGSNYDVIYRDGGQTWGNYTLEADMCYTTSTGWGGMLFNVQSDKKWQKGGITVGEKASINGFNNNWTNDVSGVNKGFTISDPIDVNKPFRLKIVVENKTAALYYAMYSGETLGEWKLALSIDNIPANAQTGSIGFLTSNANSGFVSYWIDNIKCYSSSTVSYTENFDSYDDVTFTAGATHAGSGFNYLVHKTAGTAEIKDGQVVFTGGSSHDALFFTASANWTNYAVEADVTYLVNTGWTGLAFRSKDLTNFQKAAITVDDASGNNSAVTNGKYNQEWYKNTDADGFKVAYNQADIKVNVKHRLKIVVEENSSRLYVAYYDANGNLGDWNLAITRENKLHSTQMTGMIGFMANNKCKMAFDNVVVHRGTDRMTAPVHTYTFVNGTNDCLLGGVKDHYACLGCEKLFVKDGDNYVEVDRKDLEVASEHSYSFVEEVPATENTDGVKEHYKCLGCGQLFVEVSGSKVVTTLDDLKIEMLNPVQKLVIYKENFNDITTRANFTQGVNYADSSLGGWIYYGNSANGSAYVENGKMYFSGSAYDVIYRDGGQTWGNYTLEADMCYTNSTGWGGMLFNVQSDKKWQKGGISIGEKASINGYNNNWTNDVDGVNKGFTISDAIDLNKPFRLKIVVENKTAALYYALYDGEMLGAWKLALCIDNIPANAQTGSIGFLTSNGSNNFVSYWIDNIECYSTSTVSYSENFDSYGDVTFTANAVNTAVGLNYLIPSGKTAGTAEIKDGQLVFTGGNSHDGLFVTAGTNWTNYEFESDITYLNGSGWMGLMVRSHSVTNFRKAGIGADNASGANTASINGKNNSTDWYNNVTGTDLVPYDKAVIPLNTKFRLKVVVEENSSKLYLAYYTDGQLGEWEYVMGTENRFPDGQMSGTVGFMSNNKCQVAFDNVIVRRGTDRMTEIVIPNAADIYEVESGIVNPPVVVQNLTTALPATTGERPAVLLAEVDANLNILSSNGAVLSAIDNFIDTYKYSLIPAFIIDSQAEATALAQKIKEKNLIDCYVVATSQNAALVRSVRLANDVTAQISGALIFDDLNGESARKAARALVVDNMSYVAISKTLLSEESAHYFNVRQIAAWSMVNSKADIYNGIACGYHGMVSSDPSLIYDVYESITDVTVSGKPVIIAHRGANNLIAGGPAYPENTIMGYKAAIEQYGADALEVDVRISSDGYLFLLHDPSLDRTTNGTGNAANLTLAQLKALTVDEVAGKETKIPTVEELFELIKGTDVVVYAHINVATDTVLASFNHLIDKYDCRDNVLFFISNGYADEFNSNANRTVSNSAYALTDAPVVKNGSLYTSGDVSSMFSGKSNELAGVEAMRGNLNLYNYQPLFYPYYKQGNMWSTESFYYQLSARGFVNTHSITDSQATMDTVGLTGSGAVGFLTDCIHLCDDYHYTIDVKDEVYHVGEIGSLVKKLKLIKGTVNATCGFITLDGETLTVTADGYMLSGKGSTTVVFYASRKADGGSVYTVYSKPVTITYTDHSYAKNDEVGKQCTVNGTKEHYKCEICDKLFLLDGGKYVEVDADDLVIPASHDLNDVAQKDKTCTEDGYTAHKACTKCDYTEGKTVIPASHDLKDVGAKDKTCTEDGYTAHKACSKCDYVEGKTVIPASHDLKDVAQKDKTCTEDGYTAHKACTKCDYVEGKTVIPAGHDLKDVGAKDKTCTEDGYTAHKACSKCDYIEGKTVIPAGHDIISVGAKDKTCTEDGHNAHKKCTKCDYTEGKTVIPASHELTNVQSKDNTCTEAGHNAHKKCTKCDYTEGKVIIPAGHNLKTVDAKDKTCTEDGYTAYKKCTKCDYVEGKTVVPAGHDLKDVVAKDKTCTEDGYTAHKACSKCDYIEGKTVVPAGHDFKNNVDDKFLFEKATCKSPAKYFKSCSLCGEKSTETFESGNALSHKWNNAVKDEYLVSGADCKHKAVYKKSCADCGEAHASETFESGEVLSHNWDSVVKDENLVSGADCEHKAVYKKSCTYCGEAHASETFESGEVLSHNWDNVVKDEYLVSGADCENKAVYKKSCADCGEAHASETFESGSAIGHAFKYKETVAPVWSEQKDGYELWVCENDEAHVEERNLLSWTTLSATVVVDGGKVNGAQSVTVEKGTSVTLVADVVEGKVFKHWTVNNQTVCETNEYTFVANDNVTVVAVFEQAPQSEPESTGCGANAMEHIALILGLGALMFVFKKR